MEDASISAVKPAEPPLADAKAPADAAGQRRALLIVFLVVFIDLLGFGIVLPLLPLYADTFIGTSVPEEAKGALIGVVYSVFSLMQFIFAPIWGRISDRVGRRPILLLGLVGSVVFYALFGLGAELRDPAYRILALSLIFLARAGAGVAGATIATAQAVIADTTTPERRSRGMALIGAAFGIGFTFGPLIGYATLEIWPDSLGGPAFVASGLSLVALIIGIRILPETATPQGSAAHRQWLDTASLRRALATPTIGILVLTFFMATFAFANFEGTVAQFLEKGLHYPRGRVLLLFVYIGFMLIVAQGGVYRWLARKGVTELTFINVGLILLMAGLGSLGVVSILAQQTAPLSGAPLIASVLVGLGIAVFGFAFLTPSVQALISRRSDPNRQGEILGVNQSASALARILGPLVGLTLSTFPPPYVLPYVVATVLLALVLILVPRLK